MYTVGLTMQTFKARLSRSIDEAAFRERWRDRSEGFPVEFRFSGTELTAINNGPYWDKSKEPGSFCNVLQMAVHDVARDCKVIDCEEVSQVNF